MLRVRHDAEDHGGWQFYDGGDVTGHKPEVMPKDILQLDPTLHKVILHAASATSALGPAPGCWKCMRFAALSPHGEIRPEDGP